MESLKKEKITLSDAILQSDFKEEAFITSPYSSKKFKK